jgi:hypothetical protein
MAHSYTRTPRLAEGTVSATVSVCNFIAPCQWTTRTSAAVTAPARTKPVVGQLFHANTKDCDPKTERLIMRR